MTQSAMRCDHPFHSLGGGLLASHCTLLVSHYTLHTCGVTLHTPHNIFRIIQGYYAALLNVVNRVGSTQIIIKSTFDTDVQRYLEHSRCVPFLLEVFESVCSAPDGGWVGGGLTIIILDPC